LIELAPSLDVTLLEAQDRVGGILDTVCADGFLVERSADSFITSLPWAVDLCRQVGLGDRLLETHPRLRRAFVVHGGRLTRVPAGFVLMTFERLWPLLTSPLLSPWGKLRVACEPLVPRRRGDGDESVAMFARRRLGREAFERLVQPLVGGIYAADLEHLSMSATLPQLAAAERRHGSLTRAHRAQSRGSTGSDDAGARYSLFMTPRQGLTSLVQAIVQRLPHGTVRLNCPVQGLVRRAQGGWDVAAAQGCEVVDAVIVATPAAAAAEVVSAIDSQLTALLRSIQSSGTSVVSLGYSRGDVQHPLDGFGFVVPRREQRTILAASFSSVKFAGRAPGGKELIRVFIGGELQPELAALPDGELLRMAHAELQDLLGIRGQPCYQRVDRWTDAMPVYQVHHGTKVDQIEAIVDSLPGLALAGNAYRGVGIPQCIHSGRRAAEKVVDDLKELGPVRNR
jgi:oxygen-dependent protoporphyrinogen oxidase